ncbi:hypothetical protein [Streptomyces mashuensis]|nr:hypothetical protein [Streptomyces mashuensis]
MRVAQARACILYDVNGKVHHIHHVVDTEGADLTSDSSLIERAKSVAKELGDDPRRLHPLVVESSDLEGVKVLRVDKEAKAVVTEKFPRISPSE